MGVYLGSYPMEIGAYKANTEVVLKPVTAKRSHQREKHTFVVSQGRPVSLRYVATFGRERTPVNNVEANTTSWGTITGPLTERCNLDKG